MTSQTHITQCVLACICVLGAATAQKPPAPVTVKVGSVLLEPWVRQDGNVSYTGVIPDILDALEKRMNADFKLTVRGDNAFGALDENGTWSGLVGDLTKGDIDMAATALTQTSQRAEAVDFSTPFMQFGSTVIMRRPDAVYMGLQQRLERLFAPLARDVWLVSGLAWLVVSAVLYVIMHVNPYEWRRLMRDQQATMREGEMANCANVFWFTISTLLLQGYVRAPRSLGGRVVVTFWWMFVLIFIVMYIASMTNYLRTGPTVDDIAPSLNIRSIEDLANQDKIEFGVLKGGSTSAYIKDSKDSEYQAMWRTLMATNNFVSTVSQGVDRVRADDKKPFAFITETSLAQYYAKQSPCDLYMVGDLAYSGAYSFAVGLKSPLLKQINVGLLQMQHDGTLKSITDKWFRGVCSNYLMEPSRTDKVHDPPFYKVDLGSFSGALIILVCGVILGTLATLVELCVHRSTEKVDELDERIGVWGWSPVDKPKTKKSEWIRTD